MLIRNRAPGLPQAGLTLVLWLRELTNTNYLATPDLVSGTFYYISVMVFALNAAHVCASNDPKSDRVRVSDACQRVSSP